MLWLTQRDAHILTENDLSSYIDLIMPKTLMQSQCRFVFYAERKSRYGNNASLLSRDGVPDDHLSRVIVHGDTMPLPSVNHTADSFAASLLSDDYYIIPKTICAALANVALSVGGDTLWYFGEVKRIKSQALRKYYGSEMVTMHSDVSNDLIVLRLPLAAISLHNAWLGFFGEYGPHVLAPLAANSDLSKRLEAMFDHVGHDNAERLRIWQALYRTCLTRSGLVSVCQQCSICAVPDGPHFQQVSLQSTKIDVRQIISALGNVCMQLGCSYSCFDEADDAVISGL